MIVSMMAANHVYYGSYIGIILWPLLECRYGRCQKQNHSSLAAIFAAGFRAL